MKTKEEILEFVLSAGSDSTEVFGGRFKGGYELQQCPEEITDFLERYQDIKITNFFEIGVAAGGNTRIFCDHLKIKNVHVMDLNEHPSISYEGNPNARDNNFKNLKNSGEFKSFYGDSHSEDAKNWLAGLDTKFQMVFIDGDHTEEGINLDTKLVLPYLDDNAYVIYHDTVIGVGSEQFDGKLKNGLFPQLKHEADFISSTIFKKGISVYRYGKE
jgi:hypothetical protein